MGYGDINGRKAQLLRLGDDPQILFTEYFTPDKGIYSKSHRIPHFLCGDSTLLQNLPDFHLIPCILQGLDI